MRRWWVRLLVAVVVVVLLLLGGVMLVSNTNWGRERVRRLPHDLEVPLRVIVFYS